MKPIEDLMSIELSIQQYTKVELLGPWFEEIVMDLKVINDLSKTSSLIGEIIKIQCFVKTPFEIILKGTSSYGSGAITDGIFRLPVNITNFDVGKPIIEIGRNILIKGKVRTNDHGTLILQVQSSNDISIHSEQMLSTPELKRGFKAVKKEDTTPEKVQRIEESYDAALDSLDLANIL